MLFTRIVDRLIRTSDEKLVASFVVVAVLFVVGDDLDVHSGGRLQFFGTELACAVFDEELLCRSREHHIRTDLVFLVATLTQQDRVLKAFQRHGVTNILAVFIDKNFNASRRNVESDRSSLDDQKLSGDQSLFVDAQYIDGLHRVGCLIGCDTFDNRLVPIRFGCVIVSNTDQHILIGTEMMALDDGCDLTGPQCE